MQDPARIVVEGITPVHGRPVVPHDEIAGLPNPAPYRCLVGGIRPEPVEYRLRVRKRQSLDISVATTAQVQNPAPGFRMSADKRMIYTRRMLRVIDGGRALPDIATAVVCGIVFQTEIRNFVFDLVRQAFVGTMHAAEISVAAFRGNFQRINHTGFRRIIEVRHIRMPTRFAGAETADGLSIFDHVRNDINFRMTFNKPAAVLLNGRMVQFAEAATEGNQIFIGQSLLTKQQDLMVEPGSVNGFELIGLNLCDIYAANLGAERLSSRDDFHGGIFYQPQTGTKITKRSARAFALDRKGRLPYGAMRAKFMKKAGKNGKRKLEKAHLRLRVNGEEVEVAFAPHKTLLEVLREDLRLTGTKHGCELGECGCCAVLVDGRPVLSCLALGVAMEGHEVTTVEGMAVGTELHPLQQTFAELGAAQCGYCTPGILLTAKALLEHIPRPSRDEIKEALAGNLCRCTGYIKILEAVELAAARMAGEKAEPAKETIYGWE